MEANMKDRNNKILTTFSERINSDLKVSNEQKSKLYYRYIICYFYLKFV